MEYKLTKKNIDLTPSDEAAISEKLDRIEKHLRPPFVVDVLIARDTAHQSGAVFTCRINLEEGKKVFHGERTGGSVFDAVDETIAVIVRQVDKEHDRS